MKINKYLLLFHFHGISPIFQYTTIKIIIFCACKNLWNKKNVKVYQNCCVKRLQKIFGGSYHSYGCCDDSWSCDQLNKWVTDKYFEKKVRLWTLITFHYRKCMLLLQFLSDWCLHGIYLWQKFWLSNCLNQV